MSDFGDAFKKARKQGKKTFTHNGKKYTTELAEEKTKLPKKGPVPATKPMRDSDVNRLADRVQEFTKTKDAVKPVPKTVTKAAPVKASAKGELGTLNRGLVSGYTKTVRLPTESAVKSKTASNNTAGGGGWDKNPEPSMLKRVGRALTAETREKLFLSPDEAKIATERKIPKDSPFFKHTTKGK